MTNEDKKLIADYMGWHEVTVEDPMNKGVMEKITTKHNYAEAYFDLNDASLCVKEMQKRGDIFDFYSYLIDIYNELVEQGTVICGADNFTAWLFIADNFFGAMAAWIKERKK